MRKPPSFFISYRRDDTGAEAGRLRDSLIERLGPDTVFFDLETIEPGEDYQQALDRALASCDVLLALIGPRWETIPDERGRPRLKDKKDLLRNEIRTGLKREIRVIPVLLNRDGLPTREDLPPDLYSLRRRQLFQIHRDRWHQDVDLLIERLGMTPQRKEGAAADPILQEIYCDSRVERVRSQLIYIHAQTHEPKTFLRSQVFPILRGLFVDRNTFIEPIRVCQDEKWTERFIATIETRRLMEVYWPVLREHAKPGDSQLLRSYDDLNLHLYLQELTGLFHPPPGVNEIDGRLRKADVEAVKQELGKAEIHPKEGIDPKTVKNCDKCQSSMRKIWKKWPIF